MEPGPAVGGAEPKLKNPQGNVFSTSRAAFHVPKRQRGNMGRAEQAISTHSNSCLRAEHVNRLSRFECCKKMFISIVRQ